MTVTLVHSDSRTFLATQEADSVDAVVCDPPYGLSSLPVDKITTTMTAWLTGDRNFTPKGKGFVGQEWDAFVPPPAMWDEVFRVLKPGGHLFAFSSPRTYDLLVLSCRLAGFEIRDMISAIQGQSMPKSLDVQKALTRSGAAPEVVERWSGWGTALRVSNDPILVARKPLCGTVATNVPKHGTGALNIDACRVEVESADDQTPTKTALGRWPSDVVFTHHGECREVGTREVASNSHHPARRGTGGASTSGHRGQDGLVERKPTTEVVATFDCHPDCPVRQLDEQSGALKSGANPTRTKGGKSVAMAGAIKAGPRTQHRGADVGGASRFFPVFTYAPKAKPSERPKGDGEEHVSIKSLDLMRWLVRLVGTQDRGDGKPSLILDPFGGSGTTAEACVLEGFDCLVVEGYAPYLPLVTERLARHGVTPVVQRAV